MARTPEQIQTDIDALRTRQAGGVSRVQTGDRSIQYDTANYAAVLAQLQAELASVQGSSPVTRMSFIRVGMRRY